MSLLAFPLAILSGQPCNPLLPDAAKVGKVINFTATCCILTLTMPYFLASSCGCFLIRHSYISPSPRLTESVALSTFTALTLTVQLHKSAFWVKVTHYCTVPSCWLPARGVGNISSSLETRKGQNGQPDLLLLLLLPVVVVVVMEMVLTHRLTFLTTCDLGVQNGAASSQDFLHRECCHCCYCCHQAGVSCSLKAAVLVVSSSLYPCAS